MDILILILVGLGWLVVICTRESKDRQDTEALRLREAAPMDTPEPPAPTYNPESRAEAIRRNLDRREAGVGVILPAAPKAHRPHAREAPTRNAGVLDHFQLDSFLTQGMTPL
ncbi:MAG TPA: hypothetical protein PLX89_14835 [Verrucomicrobiota bacterium]|nr:hypothetical protein [Verrucomicrobiales bacterium]HRI14267.1 hypothetical protein [Verrucomicrobiota bacterium]